MKPQSPVTVSMLNRHLQRRVRDGVEITPRYIPDKSESWANAEGNACDMAAAHGYAAILCADMLFVNLGEWIGFWQRAEERVGEQGRML